MVTGDQLHQRILPSPLGSIDEEDDAVLDEYILDDAHPADMSAPPYSPNHLFHHQSYLSTHDEETWSPYPAGFVPTTFNAVNAGSQPPQASNGHALAQHQSIAYPTYGEHPASWQPINVGSRSHHNGLHGIPAAYDVKLEDQHVPVGGMPPPHNVSMGGPSDQSNFGHSMASPQSENGWMSASSNSDRSHKNAQQEMTTRNFASFPSHMRRDGIRKKNARVEIPDGRTIDTIEEEIKLCDPSDESKLKELKQYKRLLRNREAALSSRSRKKEHAQRLEEENKVLVANEEALKMREGYWLHECQKLTQAIEKYSMKEEEMVRTHTLETAELRKKIGVLSDEIQRRPEVPAGGTAHPHTFGTNFAGYDNMDIGPSQHWDEFSFGGPSSLHAEMNKSADTAVVLSKDTKTTTKDEDPAVSGLLLMLLLCGAWVASSSGSSKPATVPEMPEDVRAASAAVLTNIYRDAGIQPHEQPFPIVQNPSLNVQRRASHPGHTYTHSYDPSLAHQMLTEPSRQQQQEDAFSLTPDQYNHITTDWFSDSKPTLAPRKRNLADALADLHLGKRTSATNAYTKSLLVDEVPANVVRDFHRMVAERNGNSPSTMPSI